MDERYNPFTGRPIAPGYDEPVSRAVALGLEPPRFCAHCGRRMVVQVNPDGWSATCSRHGVSDSTAAEAR
ncbi:biotin synthase auxiliary protein BsaP [Nocardia sp. NPDC003345]